MDLEPKLLRYLLAVSEAGSFSRAARNLNISQPALSVAIARLEDVMGMQLLDRGRHGARLTDAGRMLVRHAASVENVLATAREEARLLRHGVAGPLRIGGTHLPMASIVPDALARLMRDNPGISARTVEAADDDLILMLQRHELDIVVSNYGLRRHAESVRSVALFEARTVAVVRAGHELADRRTVSLRDLGGHGWVLPPAGGAFRRLVDAMLAAHGVAPPVNLVEADPFETLKRVVLGSDAVTLLSDQIVQSDLAAGRLVALELAESAAIRRFGLHILDGRPLGALAERYVELLVALAPRYDMPRTAGAS